MIENEAIFASQGHTIPSSLALLTFLQRQHGQTFPNASSTSNCPCLSGRRSPIVLTGVGLERERLRLVLFITYFLLVCLFLLKLA